MIDDVIHYSILELDFSDVLHASMWNVLFHVYYYSLYYHFVVRDKRIS